MKTAEVLPPSHVLVSEIGEASKRLMHLYSLVVAGRRGWTALGVEEQWNDDVVDRQVAPVLEPPIAKPR